MTDRPKTVQSVAIVGTGLLLGVVADLFFFSIPLGLNIVLYVLLFLIAAAILVETFDYRFNVTNAMFILPVLFFAAMLGVITAGFLAFLNALLMIGSLLVVVYYLTEPHFVGSRWDEALTNVLGVVVVGWVEALPVVLDSWEWLRTRDRVDQCGCVVPDLCDYPGDLSVWW